MKKRLISSLCLCVFTFSFLHAEKIIQCITNFPIDAELYTRVLKEQGNDAKVVVVDIQQYESDLLIRKGKFHRFLHQWGLDFWNKITVSENVEKIVFFNISPKVASKYALSRFPKEKMVLFMWEPKTVLGCMYLPKVQQCFSKIYTWDDSLVDHPGYFKFHYPVLAPMIDNIPSFEEKKLCTLVATDLKSSYENELYSKRKEAIVYFENAGEEGFEFYGRRWDPAKYPSYRGAIADKLGTIKNYRFSICYENTHGSPGYITEKIFDCFAAGTVPVYWGADNIVDYIPKSCFIDRRDFSNMQELHQFLKTMSKETYQTYLSSIQEYLSSKEAQKFAFSQHAVDFCAAVSD